VKAAVMRGKGVTDLKMWGWPRMQGLRRITRSLELTRIKSQVKVRTGMIL